jgi:hypothetical protein
MSAVASNNTASKQYMGVTEPVSVAFPDDKAL